MTAASDTFVAFVDVLADALDDHEATSEDLAARLYLSRYHFDRLISSVAGEPPRTFRRRILLERSAFRLLTTGRTILDIAVEAGYGSHEAYARAFTRAYGCGPQRWRAKPTQTQIEAPSDVHFHPPGGLRLPARAKETPMDLITKMIEHHVWLTGEMVTRAARLDDVVLDKPIEISVEGVDDDPTLRSLLSRLVGQMGMWNAAMASREYDWSVEKHEPIESIQRRLAVEGPQYLGPRPRGLRAGPPRRHVRRRTVRARPGVHVRRDDRPRADVRGTSPDARRGGPDRRRDHRPRRGRSAAVGRRTAA